MRALLAVAVVLALGALLLLFTGRRAPNEVSRPRAAAARGPAPAENAHPPEAEAAAAREEAVIAAPVPALPAPPASLRTDPASPSAADLVVRARFVDPHGAPIARGRLVVRIGKDERSAESGPDGEVALPLDRDGLRAGRLTFEGSAPGRTKRTKDVERRALEGVSSYFLGELVLDAGGTLAGRVVDEAGAPIALARVLARPPKATEDPAERVFLPPDIFAGGIRISSTSGEDGTYRLEGVPLGPAEVLASDGHHLVARSRVVDVRDATPTSVADLVVRTAGPGDQISGWARTAQGAPIAGVQVLLMSADEESSLPSASSTDASGRFELLAPSDVAFTLVAHDPASRRRVKHREAHAGDHGIELVFGAPQTMEVLATDEAGAVTSFSATAMDARGRGFSTQATQTGLVRLELPDEAFYVVVDEPAHRSTRSGPFQPDRAPPRLEVRLERAGGLGGVVLSGGTPVANAEVDVHVPVDGAAFGFLPADFATFVDPFTSWRVRTGVDGRFSISLQRGGRYRVHAVAPGRARASSEWISIAEGERRDDLVLSFPEAGTLVGRVLLAADAEPRGIWIGASDGEGHVALAQTGDEGRFAFAALAPGHWQVHRLAAGQERTFLKAVTCSPAEDESTPPVWDAEVRAGATTTFDIDAR